MAVVTNVYPAHLEGFGDLQTIVREKLSISEGLRTGGTFIINGDCDNLLETCRDEGINFVSFGKSNRCDVQARNITQIDSGCRFTIEGREIFLPLLGVGNVENALAAWAVCSRFGIGIDDFAEAVKTLRPVAMRAELLQIGELTVLNDCYNANPASMKNALDILAQLGSDRKGRLVFICGDMAELGAQSEKFHTELGVLIARANVQLLLAVGKFAKVTAAAAKRLAGHNLQVECFNDVSAVCNSLQKFIKNSDIILVKGSRAAKLEGTVEKLNEIFGK